MQQYLLQNAKLVLQLLKQRHKTINGLLPRQRVKQTEDQLQPKNLDHKVVELLLIEC